MVFAVACAAVGICGGCGCGEQTFTRYDWGVAADAVYPPDGFHHSETILVENSPRDTTERARMIIEYAVKELMSPERLQTQGLVPLHPNYLKWAAEAPELFGHLKEQVTVDSYYASFYKTNRRTRKLFSTLHELGVPEHYWGHDHVLLARLQETEDADYIGMYSIYERDGRYVVSITVNSGITGYLADLDEGLRVHTTLCEQDSTWLEEHKHDELVKYYNELRDKKRQTLPEENQ